MFTVYALYNRKHNKIYIGQTKEIKTRLDLHKSKAFRNSFTSRFDGEWELIYSELVNDRNKSLLRERQLKSYRGREFVKTFIRA